MLIYLGIREKKQRFEVVIRVRGIDRLVFGTPNESNSPSACQRPPALLRDSSFGVYINNNIQLYYNSTNEHSDTATSGFILPTLR